MPPSQHPAPTADIDRKIKLVIVCGLVLLMLLGLVLGSPPTKIIVALVCLVTLQGLWRGAGELIGLVASTVFAVLAAPMLGRALEGAVRGVLGTGGVLNRTISIAIVGLIIIIGGTAVISIAAHRYLKQRPQLARLNSYAGAGLGLLEGTILGMAVLWTVLALEPIAASQVAADSQSSYIVPDETKPGNPVAKGVASFAAKVRDSAFGGAAQATNPIEGARLLTLSNDFAAIVRDEAAFDYFMKTPVMQEIKSLPSTKAALERVKADAELNALFNDKGVSTDTIRAVLESQTILDIFDHTTVVPDLKPKMDALVTAIADAKSRIDSGVTPAPKPKSKG